MENINEHEHSDDNFSLETTLHIQTSPPYVQDFENDNYYTEKLDIYLDKTCDNGDLFYLQDSLDVNEFHNLYVKTNTPMSISPCSSFSDTNTVHNVDNETMNTFYHSDDNTTEFKKLTFEEVEKSLSKYYDFDNNYSNEMDILITYLKGQKNMYIQSKNLSQRTLNLLIVPCILLTTSLTIIAPLMNRLAFGWAIMSSLNAIITLLISLIKYFKLESSTEIYFNLTNQYDKIETSMEFTNNKLFFTKNKKEQKKIFIERIGYIEKKLIDIKETNYIFIPEMVKMMFPIISHVNIFSFIKKTENHKKNLINQFKDVKNEMRYIIYKCKLKKIDILECENIKNTEIARYKNRLTLLFGVKEKIKNDLIHYKNAYNIIDEIFTREIKNAELVKNWWYVFLFCRPLKYPYKYTNPIVEEMLAPII